MAVRAIYLEDRRILCYRAAKPHWSLNLFRSDAKIQPHTDVEDSPGPTSLSTPPPGEVVGLFAGIGGLEAGFHRHGFKSILLCEVDPAAQRVLQKRFPGTKLAGDINRLGSIPPCKVLTAGFPCQDLSQVGRRKGIDGPNSGLVWKMLELVQAMAEPPEWLVIENVPFMLNLDRGRAIRAIVDKLESMDLAWAYRTVDARSFGLPQRRRRVLLVASKKHDPRGALLGQDAGLPVLPVRRNSARGFYWTEGNTGIGWAENAVPPLKGGSAIHIASPPAVWLPQTGRFITPDIRDAERLQGFPADWTKPAEAEKSGKRQRWRLVGNAVCVPMAEWLASRLALPRTFVDSGDARLVEDAPWPRAAWGRGGTRGASSVSEWPEHREYRALAGFLKYAGSPLSPKAAGGFLTRLEASQLRYDASFAADLRKHVKALTD